MEKQIDNIETYIDKLIGLPVSLPWSGYGSAIFLELGKLFPLGNTRRYHQRGEACIDISWDWRCEKGHQVLFGSSSSHPEIDNGIKMLKNRIIKSIKLNGKVKELEIVFDDDVKLTTMIMTNDNPAWSIRINQNDYLYSENGLLYIGKGLSELTEDEKTLFTIAERTTDRWNVPVEEPHNGNCSTCVNFLRLDGCANFLDYGVCISEYSVFDGKVVNLSSGCTKYEYKE